LIGADPGPLAVLIVGPPDQQADLAAVLPPPAFAARFPGPADAAVPPAVILCSLETPATLPGLAQWAAGGPPVVALLAAGVPAEAALAAGASDYLYRSGPWAALLPFHLRRAADHARLARAHGAAPSEALRRLVHDLRGPLTYLVGYAELLAGQNLSPEVVRQMAQEMLRAAEQLAARLDALARQPPR
jgi:signal transduction histidine kinase